MKTAKITMASLIFCLVSLTGCQTQPNIQRSKKAKIQYLSVKSITNPRSENLTSLGSKIHSISGFPECTVQAYVKGKGFYISVPDFGTGKHTPIKYSSGLYFVSESNNAVSRIIQENAHQEVYNISVNSNWLVWVNGSSRVNSWTIWAKNLITHKSFKVYTIPPNYRVGNDPSGLTVKGNKVFWSNFMHINNDTVSEIHEYDLKTKQDRILAKYTTQATPGVKDASMKTSESAPFVGKGIIFASVLSGIHVYLSVDNSTDVHDLSATGDIYSLNTDTLQVHKILSLYHATDYIVVDGNALVFGDNYRRIPNGPNNPAPFPIYYYKIGTSYLTQLTGTNDTPFYPSASNSYVSWYGNLPGAHQLYNFENKTYYTIAGVRPVLYSDTLFYNSKGKIYWLKLPLHS